ncbi:DUF2480 family protein [Aureispira anguillae]|uniref:DUF2480 family protein n=1 Tax=Aureispira anguillae TaxID=2864201 RepID=A0A915VMI4_9BACT|nr:DUF2480 family protein [Aureispira anguillae]BDS09535.1 DUF2480 family protein [Aureispira anguillae]
MKEKPLVNRVAKSGIITINLEDYYPQGEILVFDIKEYLFRGLILREKDFRAVIAEYDWSQYQDKNLAIHCSTDAIVPIWAYQLVTISAAPYAKHIIHGTVTDFVTAHYYKVLPTLDFSTFEDQRIVIKGCSNQPVPIAAYTELARLLTPVAKKIMYGEPCSMVPLYKKK